MIAISVGDYERGHALSAEAARAAEEPYSRVVGLLNQGLALVGLGCPHEATDPLCQALEVALGVGFEWLEGLVHPMEALAIVRIAAGDHGLAVRAVGAAMHARSELGLYEEKPQATLLRAALASAKAELGSEAYDECIRAGEAKPLDEIARELLAASTARPTFR